MDETPAFKPGRKAKKDATPEAPPTAPVTADVPMTVEQKRTRVQSNKADTSVNASTLSGDASVLNASGAEDPFSFKASPPGTAPATSARTSKRPKADRKAKAPADSKDKRRKLDESAVSSGSSSLNSSLNDTNSSFYSTRSNMSTLGSPPALVALTESMQPQSAQALNSPKLAEKDVVAAPVAMAPTKMQMSTPMRTIAPAAAASTVKKLDAARPAVRSHCLYAPVT